MPKIQLRGDDTFVQMCRSILVAYLALGALVCGCIYLWHVIQ